MFLLTGRSASLCQCHSMKTRQSIKGGCPSTLCQVQCVTEIHSNPSSAFPNKQLIQTKEIWFMFTTNTQTHSLTHTQRKDSLLVNLPLRCLPNPPCWQPSIRVCPSSPEDKNTDWKKKKKISQIDIRKTNKADPTGHVLPLIFERIIHRWCWVTPDLPQPFLPPPTTTTLSLSGGQGFFQMTGWEEGMAEI